MPQLLLMTTDTNKHKAPGRDRQRPGEAWPLLLLWSVEWCGLTCTCPPGPLCPSGPDPPLFSVLFLGLPLAWDWSSTPACPVWLFVWQA